MKQKSAQDIWDTALGELQIEVSKANFNTWFKKTTGISFVDGKFTIGVPNSFIAEYLEQNQQSLIERVLAGVVRNDVQLEFQVSDATFIPSATSDNLPLFNPRYTFDTFIVGNCNNLAYVAATKVAESPGHYFNPLFIHGASGLGKTHLLHAIGNFMTQKDYQVVCVSAEQYTNEFVSAIRAKTTDDFRYKFRNVDLLMLDDVQFFAGKEQVEENFFHNFNELHNNGHQIVITSDRPPKSLPSFKERLRSRFEWGLVADLQAPDYNTRIGVLRAKAERDNFEIDEDVLEYIALQIKDNVRVLEGALNRVIAYARLLRATITPDIAARAIDDIASKQPKLAPVSPSFILEMVASAFQTTISSIIGRRRDDNTVIARQAAMYLIREETDCSLAEIGKELGGRSPATISYAHQKITNAINNDPQLKRELFNIRQKLYTSAVN